MRFTRDGVVWSLDYCHCPKCHHYQPGRGSPGSCGQGGWEPRKKQFTYQCQEFSQLNLDTKEYSWVDFRKNWLNQLSYEDRYNFSKKDVQFSMKLDDFGYFDGSDQR